MDLDSNLPLNLSYQIHHHVHNNGSDIVFNDGDTYYSLPYFFIIQFQIVFILSIIIMGILGRKLYVSKCKKYKLRDQSTEMEQLGEQLL